jgi:hypothetical protein
VLDPNKCGKKPHKKKILPHRIDKKPVKKEMGILLKDEKMGR